MDIYHEQSKNVFRTWALMTIFLVVIVALGFIFAQIYQTVDILYVAVIFALFMNFFSYWYSDKITLSLYHAQPLKSQAENPLLWNAVENMAITAGLPMPKVYIVNDPAPNAFATGRNKEHAAIAVTSGLLAILTKTELEGVVAHEMSHIGNRDILISTVVVVLLGFVSILSNIFLRSMFFGGANNGRGGKNSNQNVLVIVGVILAIFSPIALMLIQLAISRKREYLADASGALLTRYPEGLASALEKIRDYARPMVHANHATAHLFISDPMKTFGKKAASLFDTHPPIQKRIDILEGMEGKVK